MLMGLKIWLFLLAIVSSSAAHAFDLDLPLDCTLGQTCWIQNYADHDAAKTVQDFTCGSATYDGHDGTDFRLRDTTSKAYVVAAADGVVKGGRDGKIDKLLRGTMEFESVVGTECGNGVVLQHEDGYETQYCHMRQGSVLVKKGQTVKRGERLGLVGYSGAAAFPHVHLSVRRNAEKLDPFSGKLGAACGDADQSLWSKSARAALSYQPLALLDFGWAQDIVGTEDLETGSITSARPTKNWPALVSYAWLINLAKGDRVKLTVMGFDGKPLINEATLDRAKAQYVLFAGKKAKAGLRGSFTGEIIVTAADGTEKLRKKIEIKVD
jgi:hypothetical protein